MNGRRGQANVERKLRRAWSKERRFFDTQGLCHLLLWAGALIAVDFLIDWLFLLPGYGRVFLLAVNIGALSWVFYRHWWRYLHRYDPVRVALQVERRHPGLRSLLVSYVQMAGSEALDPSFSPGLVRALRRQAIDRTRPLDFREIVDFRELRRIFAFSAFVVAFFGLISLNWTDYVATFFYRMIVPSAAVKYPTRTQIESVTGDLTVRQGAAVTLEARCGGRIPNEGTLHIKPAQGQWEELALPPVVGSGSTETTRDETARTGSQTFAYHFQEVFQGFAYYVRLGDAVSQTHEVRVVPPPRIVQARVRLQFPDYVGMETEEVETLNLDVPEGTHVQWTLECDKPLTSASLLREEAEPLALEIDGNGTAARTSLTAVQSFPYRFCWVEREHGYCYEDEVQYHVHVAPDTPPEVALVRPLEDEKATVRKKLAIAFRARDDYAVSQAWVVYSLNGGDEQRLPIRSFNTQAVEDTFTWPIRETIPQLQEGDLLQYAVEVADNRPAAEGPGRARTRSLRLSIVSVEEYLRYIFEKKAALVKEVEALQEEEERASDEVKSIKEQPLAPPSETEPTSESQVQSPGMEP